MSFAFYLLLNLQQVRLNIEKQAQFILVTVQERRRNFFYKFTDQNSLHKSDFCDAIALRYGWSPQSHPSSCACDRSNNVEHALRCPNGAFPTICHNDIWDLTAELMSKVCHDASTELSLQPLSGKSLSLRSASQDVGACLASGFWGCRF